MKNGLPLFLSTAALAISVVAIVHTYKRSKVQPVHFGETDEEPVVPNIDAANESPVV